MTKLCIFCKHFDLDMGCPDWSETTPGHDAEIKCLKSHWTMPNYSMQSYFREVISQAKTCPDWHLCVTEDDLEDRENHYYDTRW
jgi:hypothetical protein